MRRNNRKKIQREKKEMEVDITSLLDILVILLVFLLKSYNPSDLKLDVVKDLALADSHSSELGVKTIIVQVDKNKNIYINNTLTSKMKDSTWESKVGTILKERSDENLRSIAEVKKKNTNNKDLIKTKEDRKDRINIVLHEELPYETLDEIMQVAANNGFHKFSFIVKSKLN